MAEDNDYDGLYIFAHYRYDTAHISILSPYNVYTNRVHSIQVYIIIYLFGSHLWTTPKTCRPQMKCAILVQGSGDNSRCCLPPAHMFTTKFDLWLWVGWCISRDLLSCAIVSVSVSNIPFSSTVRFAIFFFFCFLSEHWALADAHFHRKSRSDEMKREKKIRAVF